MNKVLIMTTAFSALFAVACGAADMNSNSATGNANRAEGTQAVGANRVPPGPSPSQVEPSGNATMGTPAAANANLRRGATPTPGALDPRNADVVVKPGRTPTSEIDQDRRRPRMQKNANADNGNPVPTPPDAGEPMMRRNANRPANVQ